MEELKTKNKHHHTALFLGLNAKDEYNVEKVKPVHHDDIQKAKKIIESTAKHYNFTFLQAIKANRSGNHAVVRQVTIYLISRATNLPDKTIGSLFIGESKDEAGNQRGMSHSSIIHIFSVVCEIVRLAKISPITNRKRLAIHRLLLTCEHASDNTTTLEPLLDLDAVPEKKQRIPKPPKEKKARQPKRAFTTEGLDLLQKEGGYSLFEKMCICIAKPMNTVIKISEENKIYHQIFFVLLKKCCRKFSEGKYKQIFISHDYTLLYTEADIENFFTEHARLTETFLGSVVLAERTPYESYRRLFGKIESSFK